MIYLSNNIIRFDDVQKLKDSEGYGVSGSLVDLTLVKSRTNKAGSVARLVFDQDRGFDPELSLLEMLKNNNLVNGAGIGLYFGEHKEFKFSQKGFKEKLKNIPEFRNIFMKTVSDHLRSIPVELNYVEPEYSLTKDIMSMINVA